MVSMMDSLLPLDEPTELMMDYRLEWMSDREIDWKMD